MMSAADPNLEILRRVAVHLGDLRQRLVLVGGTAVGLLITDPAAEAVRPTDDVDLIVELASRSEYRTGLREKLLGLSELLDQRAFRAAVPGHLRPDSISQARQAVIIKRLERLAGRSG